MCVFFFSIVFFINLAVLNRNPIYAVLYLIASFLCISSMLIYLSADYIAILIILIYGGAISILIMFVVMMLDLRKLEIEKTPKINIIRLLNFFLLILGVIYLYMAERYYVLYDFLRYINWFAIVNYKSNVEVIGIVLYNYYTFQFILLGFILFFTMVVIISLVLRKRFTSKTQSVSKQVEYKFFGYKSLK